MPKTKVELENNAQVLGRKFVRSFGQVPRIYQAPGRVNLIGEHTDYNDGFVMPAAINFHTQVAIASGSGRKMVIRSENYREEVEFDLDHLPAKRSAHWTDYPVGVIEMVLRSGHKLRGMNLLIDGDVPQGAGLSSSAAIEVAVGFGLLDFASQDANQKNDSNNGCCSDLDRTQLALLCQRAENEFVGARCGIMDQFVAANGKRGHALLLDCRSLDYRLLPLPDDAVLAICDTMVKHSHAAGEYNRRRSECESGVAILSKHLPNVRALRDVAPAELEAYGHELPEIIFRRCRHVVSENYRVLQAATALEGGDLPAFGKLMLESHRSLRDDFEVSCSELDVMVQLAEQAEGVYGTRMTGGGFGGCTIALLKSGSVEAFQRFVAEGYERATGCKPEIYICTASDGVGRVA